MDHFPSVTQSVTTDGNFPSVVPSVVTDWITDGKVFELKKKVGRWRGGFGGLFFSDGFKTIARTVTWPVCHLNCRRTHRGIWNGRSVRWRVYVSVYVKPLEKVNICTCQLCWPSTPLFLLLLPSPNSPHLQTTSPPSPPKKNLPHISTTSYISWSFVVTASVF